jgi:hypothetical protein
MTELPIYPNSHYILYAKGHYLKHQQDGTVWGDLKKIHEHYYAIEPQYIDNYDVIYGLLKAVTESIHVNLIDFLSDISPNNCWKIWPRNFTNDMYDYYEAVLYKCLSLLRHILVLNKNGKQLINLGKPDPNILPLKEV